ncbi:hypothetical protein BV20DRAFT_669146 [Pilatotrama ljubarskyi]|nr:hypothetical protein BV20DRAFT_669146 [Pilatotrama ljubarskyi]
MRRNGMVRQVSCCWVTRIDRGHFVAEIQTLRADLKQARQDQQNLERRVRELTSSETSTKFKLESLTQQLELARSEAERTAAELAAKTEEFAKYRRTKHAELTQLQAAHDSLAQTHASTESTLKALQSAHTAQSHQLTQALTRIQDLKGQLAEQEATYSSEAAGLRRLISMMEEREAQAKAIVDSLEKDFAGVGDRAERREAVLREEIENQKQRAEEAERRVEELQAVLDRMDRGEFPIPAFAGSPGAPGTPARGLSTPARNGTPSDILTQGMLGLSPTVAMASRAQRGGKSFTEVYSDYIKLQEDYARKCAEYDHMDRTLSAVLAQIEERAPILSQQRAEYERLQSEASQLASQLAQALSERDALATAAEENAQKLAKSTRENELLEKQLEDLGRQLRTLLKELGRHQDPSLPSDEELEQDDTTRPAENIEAVITNNLVLFRSIPQLQEQNQKLLKIVRELGAKLESEEKEYREALEREQGEAVREAHEAIKQLQEQLESHKRSSEVTIQAYMKERDTLRSLLERQQQSGAAPARISNGQVNGDLQLADASSDIAKELEEVQKQFETYRTEMGMDSSRLREEALSAQREATRLGTALAKANAQIEVLAERHRMVQEQIIIQKRENEDLQKRNQHLYDQYTRIDIECNRMSEDLLASNSLLEQLRNECANLRAEKKIWESVQGRLVEENKTLAMERSHLADLMANVQRMHNDLERSGENDRRRMESQIKLLEDQNQDLRTQLSQERESVRRLTLQREIDLKELQNRLEKASQELSKTRESLVAAETSKKHLEERVEQLTRQLQGNEEKLAVYERRASGVNGITPRTDEDMSREQQLEAEVAELRSALKVAEVDLASARSHVQQFQDISQANEAALATLNASHDEYKAATDAELAKRQSEIEALQEKLKATEERIAELSQANSELQQKLDNERIAWANDKRTLEETIVDMSTSAQHTQSDRTSWEVEIHQQEERAKAELRQVSSELEPTKEQLRVAQAEIEAKEQQIKLLENESRRWQERNAQLLTKYDRIDPAEMQSLKDEIAQLQARNTELEETIEKQKAEIAAHLERIHVLDEAHSKLKTINRDNNQKAKARFEREGAEIKRLTQLVAELEARVDTLTKELDEAKTHSAEAAANGAPVDPQFAQELEALRTEKANLELLLAQEKAAHLAVSSRVGEQTAALDELRGERDRLLSEKATWTATGAREEATARAEALKEEVAKANEEIRNIRLASDKYQARIQEISKARLADTERAAEEQRAAVAEAVEKLRQELQASSSAAASEEIIRKHAEELRALEERLVKKHEEELKAAVEAAAKTAGAAAVPSDTQSAIDAALEAYKKQLEEERAREIADAVERGRKEAAARFKLKDQQLVRTQARVKDLEAKLLQYENAAAPAATAAAATPAAPAPAAATSPTATPAATTAPSTDGGSAPSASTSAPPAAAPAAAAPGKAGLPARPPAARGAPGAARGRGAAPGRGLNIRGAAPGGIGRGAGAAVAAAAAAAGNAPNAAAAGAAKRARDGDAAGDDAAAKRQKQGEGAKPVQLRRDRVPPPP